jgi:anhydro-N-acetylmuramic acid kinase
MRPTAWSLGSWGISCDVGPICWLPDRENNVKLIGLMSGTSLDGIDGALIEVEGTAEEVTLDLLAFETRPYTQPERTLIQDAIESGGAEELALLHTQAGEWYASLALAVVRKAGVEPAAIAGIGSHGQTVWHRPPATGVRGSSLQLGCPSTIAERTGIGVVSDFRSRDLAAGGHGAPLVPWVDRLLYASPEKKRALQNLGGMGNVTWLPLRSSSDDLLAFDTGPGVALLDAAAEMATEGDLRFDKDGALAALGQVSGDVLEELMDRPFFREPPPRTTGREMFGPDLVKELATRIGTSSGLEGWPDVLATLTAFTARSIGEAYRRWIMPLGVDEVYLTGGGARNPALAGAIRDELGALPVLAGEDLGVDPDAKEAVAFAVLAWAFLMRVPANAPAATGAAGPRILGSWTPGVGRAGAWGGGPLWDSESGGGRE